MGRDQKRKVKKLREEKNQVRREKREGSNEEKEMVGKSDKKERIGERKEAEGEKIVSLAKAKECLLAKKERLPIVLLIYREVMINTNDLTPSLPSVVSTVLQDFADVFPPDIPKGLPPLRGIEHQIGVVPGSQLPNRPSYKSNLDETRELQRQVEELLEKGFLRESMSPMFCSCALGTKKRWNLEGVCGLLRHQRNNGYIAYNFVIGAYSYWGPKAGYYIYHMNNADLMFGGITIICGIFGTLAGGFVLDLMTNTISNAFKLLSVATFFGAIFCFAAFCFKSLYVFIALFAIGELFVFATQGPVNYVCLHCVKPSMRPLSMAMSTVSIHIFGDVPSSPLVGVLQDHINNWRVTALILTSVLFLASGIWVIGVFLHSVDRFNEENELQVSVADRSNTIPLLGETTQSL